MLNLNSIQHEIDSLVEITKTSDIESQRLEAAIMAHTLCYVINDGQGYGPPSSLVGSVKQCFYTFLDGYKSVVGGSR